MATIHDVAKLAGVGVGTASRALSGNGAVARETRIRVHEAAAKLNFRPSSAARALSRKEQGLIGILTPQFDGLFFGQALNIAEREIRKAGKHLMVASSKNAGGTGANDEEALGFLQERDCDGILIFQSGWGDRELIALANRLPAIAIFNRDVPTLEDCCFATDHYAAGRAVGEYLLAAGHRRFATITGPQARDDARARHLGFVDALKAANCEIDPRLIVEGDFFFSGGADGANALIRTGLPFTAVFCGNDEMAIAANLIFQRANRDLQLFGYDNIETLRYAGLKIGSVSIPIEEMISNACASLFNRCYGQNHTVSHRFSARIVPR